MVEHYLCRVLFLITDEVVDGYLDQDMAARFFALKGPGTEPSCETIGVLLTALCSCRLHEDVAALLNCIQSCKRFGVIAWLLEEREESQGNRLLWVEATVLFDVLQSEGAASRLVLYDSLVEALWCFGWRGRAWKVLMAGRERGVFPQARVVADEELLLDLHLLSVNVAQVMLVSWLSEMESTCIKEDTPYEQVRTCVFWFRLICLSGLHICAFIFCRLRVFIPNSSFLPSDDR